MLIQSLRWLGASALGLSLALIPHLAHSQESDELVTAIKSAFSEDESQPAAPAVDKQQQENELAASDDQPPAVAAEVVAESDIAASHSEPQPAQQPSASAEATEPATQRELSVPPLAQPYYPEDMPAWTKAPAGYENDQYVVAVGSIPTVEKEDADDALDEQLLASLYRFIDDQLIEPGASWRVRDRVTVDYIRTNLIDDPLGYTVQLQTSSGPMYQKWVQLIVSKEQQQQLREWHREAIQRERIVPLGLGMVGLLTLVSGFHVLMRRAAKSSSKPGQFAAANRGEALRGQTRDGDARDGQVPPRVELPVMKSRPAKKACCSKGYMPLAFVAIPILVAIVASKRAKDARERDSEIQSFIVVDERADTQVVTHHADEVSSTRDGATQMVIIGE